MTDLKIAALKKQNCKLNPSSFISLIVRVFFDKYYDKELNVIEDKFFDEKSYLKSLIKDFDNSDNLSRSVEELLKKVKKSKYKVPTGESAGTN